MPQKRSRAYPLLSLEESCLAIGEVLEALGAGFYSREVLGEVLGHTNAQGGPGARKIASLAQFGLLRRKAGRYSPSSLAERVLEIEGARKRNALRTALRQPLLFRDLLAKYEPQGRVPAHLASVLWQQHGITKKASTLAAENFTKSARFARILDKEGCFVRDSLDDRPPGSGAFEPNSPGFGFEQQFVFALTAGKIAKLSLPGGLTEPDITIIRQQIELIGARFNKGRSDDEW